MGDEIDSDLESCANIGCRLDMGGDTESSLVCPVNDLRGHRGVEAAIPVPLRHVGSRIDLVGKAEIDLDEVRLLGE